MSDVDTSGTGTGSAAWCSVVVPAHDEARVIRRCLDALVAAADGRALDIVVVANGCSDDTAAVARDAGVPGVRVVELVESSKVAALNAGDRATDVFPRLYLDADITLDAAALGPLVTALDVDEAVVAAPGVHFDTSGASWPVRAFYDVFRRLPYASDGLTGLGLYGLSAAGRARFATFPDLTADDLFVQRLFGPDERRTTAGTFTVRVPADLANLVRVRTRVARGNAELAGTTDLDGSDGTPSARATLGALARLVRRTPRLAPSALVYLGVVLAGRLRARRGAPTWDRDRSTR